MFSEMIQANDVKKGWAVEMRNGFRGEMYDNKKGNIRTVNMTDAPYPEIGSVYIWDILTVTNLDGETFEIDLTPRQRKAKANIQAMGF